MLELLFFEILKVFVGVNFSNFYTTIFIFKFILLKIFVVFMGACIKTYGKVEEDKEVQRRNRNIKLYIFHCFFFVILLVLPSHFYLDLWFLR